jgi:competence protein ComEA
LASLSRRELAGLAGVVLVALAAVALWYVRSLPRPVELRTAPAQAVVAGPSVSATPSPAVIVVNVAGWVVHPGVFEFREGDRVIDALEAAGGAKKGAALDALNLAALLTDAQQVLVPKLAPGGGVVVTAPGGSTSSVGGTTALININSATEADLETLPSVGPVLAQRIVDYRTANGPFATVDDIDAVSGIGPATLEDLRDLITV